MPSADFFVGVRRRFAVVAGHVVFRLLPVRWDSSVFVGQFKTNWPVPGDLRPKGLVVRTCEGRVYAGVDRRRRRRRSRRLYGCPISRCARGRLGFSVFFFFFNFFPRACEGFTTVLTRNKWRLIYNNNNNSDNNEKIKPEKSVRVRNARALGFFFGCYNTTMNGRYQLNAAYVGI